MRRRKEINFSKIDTYIIKGIAILMMLFHHLFLSPDRYEGYQVSFDPLSQNTVTVIAKLFKICVGIFVILSAYGLTLSLKKYSEDTCINAKQYEHYLKTRLIKLLWGFWFAYLFSAVVSLACFPYQFSKYFASWKIPDLIRGGAYAVIDFLGFAELFHSPTLNGTWWYMSLAILMVMFVPILCIVCKKYGNLFVSICCFVLPRILNLEGDSNNMIRWTFAIVLGIMAAQNNWFVRWKTASLVTHPKRNKIIKIIISILLLIISGYISEVYSHGMGKYTYEFRHCIIPFLVIAFVYLCITDIPIVSRCFWFLGKHSMNIFLIHTFIRHYYFEEWTYSFGNCFLIFVMLLFESLIVSIIMEQIKKIIRYDKQLSYILKLVQGERKITKISQNKEWRDQGEK